MAKTRINERMRAVLGRLARSLVACPIEQADADAAYKIAAVLVRKIIEARYPPKHMAILKQYDQANAHHCVLMQLTPGGFQEWRFRNEDKQAPLQPGKYHQTHIADEAVTTAVHRSITADDALKTALEKKTADYYALIAAANTFEDVCEVWPEAEAARGDCGASAIVVAVTPDVVARIRADVSARAVAGGGA